jgi:hypothetical protein
MLDGGYGTKARSLEEMLSVFSTVHGRNALFEVIVEKNTDLEKETLPFELLQSTRVTSKKDEDVSTGAMPMAEWQFGLETFISEIENKNKEKSSEKCQVAYSYRGGGNMYEVTIEPIRKDLRGLYREKFTNELYSPRTLFDATGMELKSSNSGVFVKRIISESPAAFARPEIKVGDEVILVAGLPASSQIPDHIWTQLPLSLTLRMDPEVRRANQYVLPNQVDEKDKVEDMFASF